MLKSAFFTIVLVAANISGQSVGTLQGSLTDERGVPVPGAVVKYHRIYMTVPVNNHPLPATPDPPVPPLVPNPDPPGNPPPVPVFPPVPNPPTTAAPGAPAAPGKSLRNANLSTAPATMVAPAPGEAVVQGQVGVDSNGGFIASSLPVGDYSLCAAVPSAPYPDSCQWGTPVRVSVVAGGPSSASMVLTKGVFLKVRVNDPSGLLPQSVGPFQNGKLLVGVVFGAGVYVGAQIAGINSSGRDYQVIVPVGVPLKVRLFSRDVALTDNSGKSTGSQGAIVPFQATAGQDQVFAFTISGVAQSQ